MSEKKFVTIVHNALSDGEKIGADLHKLGFADSFDKDGQKIVFPTSPIRLYFKEENGDINALRDKYIKTMEDMWKRLNIKAGVASVLVGDDWRI